MTRPSQPIFWTNLPQVVQPPTAGAPATIGARTATPLAAPVIAPGSDGRGLPKLDSIGMKFRSDKASPHHGFLDFYERFLDELRHSATAVLEVGVSGGESLRMWEEFFPNARIFGTDHRPECQGLAGGRISMTICEPSDVMRWVDLAARHGPFDLIIDDASHMWEYQIAALRTFYPFVRPGGYYILEDIDTSYGDYVERYRGDSRMSAARYLHALSDVLVGGSSTDPEAVDDAFLKSAAMQTEFLAYFRRTSLLRRRPA